MLSFLMPAMLLGCFSIANSSPVPDPGTKTNLALGAAAAAGIGLLIHKTKRTCKKIGISPGLCAVMYEDEECDTTDDYKELKSGDAGKLPYSLFTTGLSRNDVESMIVSGGCKLELWDDANGLANGESPDLVIDQTEGPTKYVDDMEDEDSFGSDKWEDLQNAISSYRCTCGPTLNVQPGMNA